MTTSWNQLAKNLENAYLHFIDVASQLDESLHNKAGVCGTWSPREVVTHLIGWDMKASEGFTLFAKGEANRFDFPDVNEFNDQSVRSYQHLNWDETISALSTAQATLQAKIRLVENKGLDAESGFGKWLIGRCEDYELHTRQLQAWVSSTS